MNTDGRRNRGQVIGQRRVYRLYRWQFTPLGFVHTVRGSLIAEYNTWRDLQADVRRRTALAGYPMDDWMYLYDWNMVEVPWDTGESLPVAKGKVTRRISKSRTHTPKRKSVARRKRSA